MRSHPRKGKLGHLNTQFFIKTRLPMDRTSLDKKLRNNQLVVIA